MTECESNREVILNWTSDPVKLSAILFGKGEFPNSQSNKCVSHVQSCASCKEWLKSKLPKDVYKRQSRISNYCCPMMYSSVEENDPEDVHMTVRWVRDDTLWVLDQPNREYGFVAFSYCPWCGMELPNGPFINDDRGIG